MLYQARVVFVASVLLAGAACGGGGSEVGSAQSFEIAKPPSSVAGNVLSFTVDTGGLKLVKADGDTTGKTGHVHVFIDREPVAEGQLIAQEAGIVHSADNPVTISGLAVGKHRFAVVMGDGRHARMADLPVRRFEADVRGPSVKASAPATAKAGEEITVDMAVEGIEIVKADGDTSGKTGHFHVLVDPAKPPAAGDLVPTGQPMVLHSAAAQAKVPGLTAGAHTIWVVVGDGTHKVLSPLVATKLSITVA